MELQFPLTFSYSIWFAYISFNAKALHLSHPNSTATVDGSFRPSDSKGGIGSVVHDHNGSLLAGFSSNGDECGFDSSGGAIEHQALKVVGWLLVT